MRGKTCLITGATQGVGFATAKALATKGARVVLVGRDETRTARAVTRIKEETGNSKVSYLIADLSSFDAVRELARTFKNAHSTLDVLINNAGGMSRRRKVTSDNFELSWKVNHLAYFLLTAELLPLLKASSPARIINVASTAHYRGQIDFDDLQGEKHYAMWKAYQQSKLANVMFTYALARRLEGTGVTANCLHPGLVASGFVANIGPLEKLFAPLIKLVMISPEEGAKTSIYLASALGVASINGKYFDKGQPMRSSDASYNEDVQERLWALSAEQTGVDVG